MLLTKGALLVLLTACSNPAQATTSSEAMNFSYASSSVSASKSVSVSSSLEPPGSNSISIVSCSGDECTVTLGGSGSSVGIFGATISFVDVQDGRATIRVDDEDVSCTAGQTVTAGPLTLTCTRVGDDTVEFTASPR